MDKKPTNYTPNDYLKGRVALPPDIYSLPKETFFYGDDIAIANNATAVVSLAIEDNSYFLVEAIQIISSVQSNAQDLATVQITESASGRSWSNKPVPLRDLSGRGDVPKYLSDPNLLRPSSTLSIQITNSTGGQAQFYCAIFGKKIYKISPDQAALMARRQWFQYVLNVATLNAAANEKLFTVQIEDKADFLVKRLLSSQLITAVIGAAAGAESAEVMWNLRNKSTGTNLFSKKLAARLMLGQLAGPSFVPNAGQSYGYGMGFPLKNPWPARRNTILEGVFDNRSAANIANGFNVILEGIKTFDKSPVPSPDQQPGSADLPGAPQQPA